jgi:hypothetical protein
MGIHRAKFEALTGIIDIKEGNNIEAIIAGMTDAKSRTGKGNQYVCYYIRRWVTCRLYDVQSCWHGNQMMHN